MNSGHRTPARAKFSRATATAPGSVSPANDAGRTEFDGGFGEYAGTGADVDHGHSGLDVALDRFEAEPGRFVRSGSKRQAGVDYDRMRPGGVGSSSHSGITKMRSPIPMGCRCSRAKATQSRVSAGCASPPKRARSSGWRASSSKKARRAPSSAPPLRHACAAGFPEIGDGEILYPLARIRGRLRTCRFR